LRSTGTRVVCRKIKCDNEEEEMRIASEGKTRKIMMKKMMG